MDIYEFIKAEDKRLMDLMGKLLDTEAGKPEVRKLLVNQARIQFGALSRVEGEHFYPALDMYEETKEIAGKHKGMVSEVNSTLDELVQADPAKPETRHLIESLHSQMEMYLKNKEGALFDEVRETISEELAESLGRAAQEDINHHRRKLAGEKG